MTRYLVRRVLGFVPTFLAIIAISFVFIRFAPGSPFTSEKAIPLDVRAELRAQYGFDQPLPTQLGMYLKNLLLHGDLGRSTKYPARTVNQLLADGLPVTMSLGLVALLWALWLGVAAGIIGAVRQNTIWDHGAMAAAIVGISLPSFVLGPLLVFGIALNLLWLPAAGWGRFEHVVLPGITLGTVYAAYVARLTRGGMLEVVRQDFVRTAKAKGLPERLVIWRHMLKGGLLPLVTFLGPMVAHLLVGSVVVEKIFVTPGIGPYLVDATFNRDYFLVMGIVVVECSLVLVLNLLVDIAYGFMDPRVRYD